MCDSIWSAEYPHVSIGMTMFHELMHMTTGVTDYRPTPRSPAIYDTNKLFKLAIDKPDAARLSAKNYTLFAMESGMNKDDFMKYSEGRSIIDMTCKDLSSGCYKLASGCCKNSNIQFGNGNSLTEQCCASCTHFDSTKTCKKKATCSNKYGNCAKIVQRSPRLCNGRLKKDCCEACSEYNSSAASLLL